MTNQPLEKRFILVMGATGIQGGEVVRHLLKQGFPVRAFVRDSQKSVAQVLADRGAELFGGDPNDRASIDKALQDVDRVFSVQTYRADSIEIKQAYAPMGRESALNESEIEMEIQQGVVLADAAKAASVNHFVYASVGSANRQTGIPHFDSKGKIEQYIRGIALPYTILRPTFYMHNWDRCRDMLQKGMLQQPLHPDTKLQQVSIEDLGAFATLAFANPQYWIGREVDLAGDELTMQGIADTFSQVLDRPVNYVQISWDQFEQEAGTEQATMYRWLEKTGYAADIAVLRQEYPALLTFKQYLLQHE